MDFFTVETAVALAQDELPTIAGIGAKTTATIDDAVLAILAATDGDKWVPLASVPNDKKNKAQVIATVAKFNKVAERDNLKHRFAMRTSEDKESVTLYGANRPQLKVTRNRTATS